MTTIVVPQNKVVCWYLHKGWSVVFFYGALTQSHLPSLCLRSPQASFRALESGPLPPYTIIMPVALPALQTAALCYTRLQGPLSEQSKRTHEKGARSTFKHQTSLTGSDPEFPPNTSK